MLMRWGVLFYFELSLCLPPCSKQIRTVLRSNDFNERQQKVKHFVQARIRSISLYRALFGDLLNSVFCQFIFHTRSLSPACQLIVCTMGFLNLSYTIGLKLWWFITRDTCGVPSIKTFCKTGQQGTFARINNVLDKGSRTVPWARSFDSSTL